MLYLLWSILYCATMLRKEKQAAWPQFSSNPSRASYNSTLSPLSWKSPPSQQDSKYSYHYSSQEHQKGVKTLQSLSNTSGEPRTFQKVRNLLLCQSLRHLLDAVHGCLHWRSSESLPNCPGVIKMQTILRLHNSSCKRVAYKVSTPWQLGRIQI